MYINDVYEKLKKINYPLIIYGMGNGADKILHEFEKRSISINGIAASDDFVRGQSFHGFEVKKISEYEKAYGRLAVVIAFGTALPDVMERIFSLAEKHIVFAVDTPVYGDNIWDSGFYEENRLDIERTYELLADNSSKDVYEKILKFKLTGDISCLRSAYSEKDEVFRDILKLSHDESFLDLGAYRGDTIDEFLKYTDGYYESITALEPDRKNFAKLKKHIAGMKNIRLFRMGIWSEDMEMMFGGESGRGSGISDNGCEKIAVTKIDTLYSSRRLTYLKMDVEGSERQALLGGMRAIKRDRPKLNIALYHRSEDIFSIPLLVNDICPDYRLYIRQHPYIPAWDLNLYAISESLAADRCTIIV